jgi:class 3 adenylate cyclase
VAVCTSCGRESAEEFAFCPHCEAAFAPPQAAREQRKVVTVLFCDVTGSTDLGEQLDPEALRSLLARYFERMKAIVERHGGSVEKFIGDAVMAVFGVPVVHEDDALRGLRARSRCGTPSTWPHRCSRTPRRASGGHQRGGEPARARVPAAATCSRPAA